MKVDSTASLYYASWMNIHLPIMDSNWWSFQLFKSKLIGSPIYHEILTQGNNVVKVIFFEGVAFNRNDIATFIEFFSWSSKRHYTLCLQAHDLPKLTLAQRTMVQQLVDVGIAVPEYETHPYHKLKNPALISYDKGPKFDDFVQVFAEVLYEKDLIVETEVLDKEANEQI